ncbi:MAG: sensor domain-containing diguanylate cyclase [Spirochaetota bacterium]|nr:MAG: sensor domain-containing diguanylate cyclase [Spirochaetota bacterium]
MKRRYSSLWIITGFLALELLIFFGIHYFLDFSIVYNLVISLAVDHIALLLGWKRLSRWLSQKETVPQRRVTDKIETDRIDDEVKTTPKKLQKQIYDLHNLFEISINLTSILDPVKLIQSSMLLIIGQLRIDQVIIFLPSRKAGNPNVFYPVYSKGFSKDLWKGFYLSLKDPVLDMFGEKVLALDLSSIEQKLFNERWHKLINNGIKMIAPIIPRKMVKGVIAVGQKINKEPFSQSEQELFSLLAHFISVAVANSILYQKMERISITDGMTELYNYRYFKRRLDYEVVRASRYNHCLSLVLFDVDYFKNYNDTLGHPAGDAALKKVAMILRSMIRKSDIPVRYGGEEFCVILPEGTTETGLVFAERLRKQIEAYRFEREEVQPGGTLTVSLGVASFPKHADSAQQLVKEADAALYRAKGLGRNRTCLASEKDK